MKFVKNELHSKYYDDFSIFHIHTGSIEKTVAKCRIYVIITNIKNVLQEGEYYMPGIGYIDLFDEVQKMDYDPVCLSCCDLDCDTFSLMRVQMQEDIYYTQNNVYIADEIHDRKCISLLRTANREGIDLLLFPEYCISINVLRQIAADKGLWPDEMKLWCLPCQGIPWKCFEVLRQQLREMEQILLIENAVNSGVNRKKFVNVMFYCFCIWKEGRQFLCLAPQMKTHHMSDPTCVCEVAGLTTGSKIFTLGKRIVTFLCADTLNNSISWQNLQRENLTNGIIILHPQMNRSPKHKVFRRVRDEMWNHNHPGLCITCNWAAGTRLISANAKPSEKPQCIDLSWSCIYEKNVGLSFKKWQENTADARKESACYDLFAAFMEKQKTEVWFSTSAEQAVTIILPNQITNQYGATTIHSLKATERFCWRGDAWKLVRYSLTLEDRMKSDEAKEELGQSADIQAQLEPCYHFPFTEPDKYLVDRFFSLTLPNAAKALLTIDEDENLADWGILLDKTDFIAARAAFRDFYTLICKALKGSTIPRRLYGLKGEHKFICEGGEASRSCFNVISPTGKMLIVFAKDDVVARQLSKALLEKVFDNNTNLAECQLGVVYSDFAGEEFHFLPESTADISHGDHLIQEGDLTNGRD